MNEPYANKTKQDKTNDVGTTTEKELRTYP